VLVQASLRASYLVGAAMQLAYLIKEGLELGLFDAPRIRGGRLN
jgi:hypothetical protein